PESTQRKQVRDEPHLLALRAHGEESARRAHGEESARRAHGEESARRAQGEPITKWDIFHYVYGVLHHPGYRSKFADNLKRELTRIRLAPAVGAASRAAPGVPLGSRDRLHPASGFRAFADAGRQLARLHLDYEQLEPWPLQFQYAEGVPLSYHVEK